MLDELVKHLGVACYETGISHRYEKAGIVCFRMAQFIDLTNLLTHIKTEVPKGMQEVFNQLFFIGGDWAAEQNKEVDIGVEAELASAITSNRYQCHW
jgi:hypothetical protein